MHHNTPHIPEAVPKTASNFLEAADRTLDSRGQQYDPHGKQERSMTAIVAAFNAIYPIQLTVHMGWQFMTLVKMVRGATKPHADSALDQVAYAALAAEEVASQLHSQEQLREAYAHNPYVGKAAEEADVKPEPTAAERIEQLLAHNRSLEVQLDNLRSSFASYACRFDLTKEYMTKEQVLAGQAKHEEQVAKLQARELMDIDSLNNLRIELQQLRAELADRNNLLKDADIERNNWQNCLERAEQQFAAERAAHKATDATVSRLLGKNNALCNEVRNLEVAVASVRNSLKVSEDAASKLQAKALYHQEQHNATLLELRKEREAHQHTARVRYS